jgi:hypothetical protein
VQIHAISAVPSYQTKESISQFLEFCIFASVTCSCCKIISPKQFSQFMCTRNKSPDDQHHCERPLKFQTEQNFKGGGERIGTRSVMQSPFLLVSCAWVSIHCFDKPPTSKNSVISARMWLDTQTNCKIHFSFHLSLKIYWTTWRCLSYFIPWYDKHGRHWIWYIYMVSRTTKK